MKDWIGNSKSIYTTLGANSHSEHDREQHDYYATEPKATDVLLEVETFNNDIWECACGEGHISKQLELQGYKVVSTDLVYRGYGQGGVDFFKCNEAFKGDIITNPPYKQAKEFVDKALQLVQEGNKVAMFLKLQFLEGKARKELFLNNPPKVVYVSSSRLKCAMNGEFKKESSAVAYAWYIWEKGYTGDPIIKWIN